MDNVQIGIVIVIVFLIGALVGKIITDSEWQGQAVEHSCAAYDATTGEWRWNSE